MKIPKRFIKKGKFNLHSGQISKIFYDVNKMLTDKKQFTKVLHKLNKLTFGIEFAVGIATGGAIIASNFREWAMIKDGELKGNVYAPYILIDDVCTTENSLNNAIKIIGIQPAKIFVVVDRRKKKTLKINSLYRV